MIQPPPLKDLALSPEQMAILAMLDRLEALERRLIQLERACQRAERSAAS